MMKKVMIGAAALALTAGTLTVPKRANALAEWVIPTIVATGLGGVVVGSAATQNGYGYEAVDGYGPRACHMGREQGPDGSWHRVRVCPY